MKQLRMIRSLENIPEVTMPTGFFARTFCPGDEEVWLEICKHGLLEADAGPEAWAETMLAQKTLVPQRDVYFICREDGTPVATYASFVQENGIARAHMVAAKEEARGHGLGKVISCSMIALAKQQLGEQGRFVDLNTDDWRIPAVVSYLKAGFHPVLFDEGMQERWQAVCDQVNLHGVEMLTLEGAPTGILL